MITEADTTPPSLEWAPDESRLLGDELAAYPAESVDLYYRVEQARWRHRYRQGRTAPIESPTIQPMAMAVEDANIRAWQLFIGQGKWEDKQLLKKR